MIQTAEHKPLKWRKGQGGYLAEIKDVGTVRVFKMYDGWKIHLTDGYYVNHNMRLLADAKRLAADPEWLPLLITGREQRQAKEQEKQRTETVVRTTKVVRECRLTDSHLSPPVGVPWYEWAERKVGCTAADVRKSETQAGDDEIWDDVFVERFEDIDSMRRSFFACSRSKTRSHAGCRPPVCVCRRHTAAIHTCDRRSRSKLDTPVRNLYATPKPHLQAACNLRSCPAQDDQSSIRSEWRLDRRLMTPAIP